ncbi:HAD family phosphatase [Mycetocola tolaasinivorans]|uniref:HAD family phosphatase n=1 Tax=Mycetocola tolaasinivorans TaxID=76635 RepID=A0A3L7A6Z4_9MICO|nr:HAD family phosphatase [Mycetocola tolaasinivorans]RLP76089.1 HAD family phosphatase [Mycetocola tolaasinivorans]
MSLSLSPLTVVFDYGDVISLPQNPADFERVLELTGLDADTLLPAYWRHRAPLDQGRLSVHEYWRTLADELGTSWSDSRIQEIWISDFRSWLSIDPAVFDIIRELHEGGTRLALLSNAGADFGGYFRHGPLSSYFDHFVVSGEIDMIKPNHDIYVHTLNALGIDAAEMVFIDNKEENISAARALGIIGHVYTSPGNLREFLSELAASRA